MKNYPHLYPTPVSKKVSTLARTPQRKQTVTPTITTKPSSKTFMPYQTPVHQKRSHIRNLTRSIDRSKQSQEHQPRRQGSVQDQELFSQSYSKIGRLKRTRLPQQNIDAELNQVLGLIRQEKQTINQRMRALKRSNEQYRQLCESYMKGKIQCGVNTQWMTSVDDREEKQVQCNLTEFEPTEDQTEISEKEDKESEGKKEEIKLIGQNYDRMAQMLTQMKINPKDILPERPFPAEEQSGSQFNSLGEKQIIQIQKFFIKKLIQKLPK